MDQYGLSILNDTSSSTNERDVPESNTTPPSNMPALRSQGEFFMTGIIPASSQPEDSDCSICAEHLAEDVVQIARPCSHMFHAVCLLTWLEGTGRQNRTCPNCRCELYAAPVPRPSMNLAPTGRTREGIMEQRIQVQYETLRRAQEDQVNNLRVLENNLRSTQIALGREPAAARTPIDAEPVNIDRRSIRSADTAEAIGGWRRRTQAEMRQMSSEDREIIRRLRRVAQEQEAEAAHTSIDMEPANSDRLSIQSAGTPDTIWRRRTQAENLGGPTEDRNTIQRMSQMVRDGDAPEVEALIRRHPLYHALRGEPVAGSHEYDAIIGRAEEEVRLRHMQGQAEDEIRQLETARDRLRGGLLDDRVEAAALERALENLNGIKHRSREQLMSNRRAAEEDSSSDDSTESIRFRRRYQRMSARQAAGEGGSSDNSTPSSRVAGPDATLHTSRVSAAEREGPFRAHEENMARIDAALRGQTNQTSESAATSNLSPRPTQSAAPSIWRTIYPAPPRNITEPIAPTRDVAPSRLARVRRTALLAGRGDEVPEQEIAESYDFPGLAQLHDEPAFASMSNPERMRVCAQAVAELSVVDTINEQDDEIHDLFWRTPGRQPHDNN